MKDSIAFYTIGTVGMIVSATLHMVMALFILDATNHGTWWGIYPVFLTFLAIGSVQMIKSKQVKQPER